MDKGQKQEIINVKAKLYNCGIKINEKQKIILFNRKKNILKIFSLNI